MAEKTMLNPRLMITIVITAAVLIMFGAMIFGQLSAAVNDMPFMNETDTEHYDEQAAGVVKSVQSNAWIGFSLMAIIILVIVAYTVISIF